MILEIYSVYDKAVGAFLPPFYARAKGEALRQFTAACNDEKHIFALNPHDYTLFSFGTFDDVAGVFAHELDPKRIVSAFEVIVPADETPPERARPARVAM